MDATNTPLNLRLQTVRSAWLQAMPIVIGYLPIGFAFGILSSKAGISSVNTIAMSLLVFAGSSQLIAVSLFAAGAAPWSIVVTTFIVNLRHLLMSASLSPHLHRWRRALIPFFAYEITDETFAVHSVRFGQGKIHPAEAILINVIAQISWVCGTLLGIFAGDLIQDVQPLGLDYALIAMFIALLVFQIKDNRTLTVAVFSGVLSTLLLLAGVDQWNVILATVLGATIGVILETWTRTSSS